LPSDINFFVENADTDFPLSLTTPNLNAEELILDKHISHQIVSKVKTLELKNNDAFRVDLF